MQRQVFQRDRVTGQTIVYYVTVGGAVARPMLCHGRPVQLVTAPSDSPTANVQVSGGHRVGRIKGVA